MADRRSRDHDARRHHGAGLHHQYGRRSPPHPDPQRGQGGDRLRPRASPSGCCRRADQAPSCAFIDRHRAARLGQRRRRDLLSWAMRWPAAPTRPTVASQLSRLTRDDVACLIYTSGTGGTPKGVMLSHGAILANCRGAYRPARELGLGDEVFLSFLPLSHSYEHTAGQIFPISLGAPDLLRRERREAGRQHAGGAADHHDRGAAALRDHAPAHPARRRAPGRAKPKLFDQAVALGSKRYERPGAELGERCSIRCSTGWCAARSASASAAGSRPWSPAAPPLNPEIGMFFIALGLHAAAGLRPDRGRAGDQLQPPDAHQARHRRPAGRRRRGADRRGRRDPGARRDGDEGLLERPRGDRRRRCATAGCTPATSATVDADGYLKITDRKKDIIVNCPAATMISPARVEGYPDAGARDRAGDGVRRRQAAPRGADRARARRRRAPGRGGTAAPPELRRSPTTRVRTALDAGGRAGQRRAVADRARAPLRGGERAVHDRERDADRLAQDPPPQDPRGLRRGARAAV